MEQYRHEANPDTHNGDGYGTSISFGTEAEATAFLVGFRMASSDMVLAHRDCEEPFAINLDLLDEDAFDAYVSAVAVYKKLEKSYG
jgi:hypothetical protein